VWFRRNKILLGKVILLVVMLLLVVSGLGVFGCIKGLQPIGWSGGAVADGTLFVGSEQGRLVAVNLADGSRQWSEELKMQQSTGLFGCAPTATGAGCAGAPAGVAVYGTPAVTEDLVYIGGYNGKIYAFSASTLVVRWIYPREGNLEPIVGGSAVSHGKVYIGATDQEDKKIWKLYAMDAATGDWEWDFQTGDKIWSTPAIY
jgi:outer membrane protein assembly factor BamB